MQRGAADTGAESKEECKKCEGTGDWVEDHDAGEALGGLGRGVVERSTIDLSHFGGRRVADVATSAPVLVGCFRSNIEDAVSKGAKCNG